MDPMLITRAGSSWVPAASSSGTKNLVRWKTPLTLRASTRSKAASSKSASGVPQVAPALLTRMSRVEPSWSPSRRPAGDTRPRWRGRPGCRCRCPWPRARPPPASTTSALRDEMYTVAPASTKPSAIILPMPRVPPVTRAVLPSMEKRSCALIGPSWSGGHGAANATALRTMTSAPTRSARVLHREGGAVVHAARAVGRRRRPRRSSTRAGG